MYIVDAGYKKPKFKTLTEACLFANKVAKTTGIILGVYEEEQYKKMLRGQRR